MQGVEHLWHGEVTLGRLMRPASFGDRLSFGNRPDRGEIADPFVGVVISRNPSLNRKARRSASKSERGLFLKGPGTQRERAHNGVVWMIAPSKDEVVAIPTVGLPFSSGPPHRLLIQPS